MHRQKSMAFANKKVVRDTYASHAQEFSDFAKEKLNEQIITGINFGEDAMVILTKTKLTIYSLLTKKVFFTRKGVFWDALMIPNSSLLAYLEHDGTLKSKRTLVIFDLQKEQRAASVTITFEIEEIKVTKSCICLSGINELSVIHFPSLKPIFHELVGSGLKVIFDISFEGLTIAANSQNKGEVVVHNFSSVLGHKARRRSMEDQRSNQQHGGGQTRSFIRKSYVGTGKSFLGRSVISKVENPKKHVKIQAHQQYVSIIKLSPNGSRVATASLKGTLIRIFLAGTGKLWEQLRIGYELCKIIDVNFYEQGNVISCLSEKSMVYLFNAKLEENEELAESEKRGYKIYQQQNPKSFFSFLYFLNSNLGNEHPFAFFQLTKPVEDDPKQESVSQKKQQEKQYNNSKESPTMAIVLEEAEMNHNEEEDKKQEVLVEAQEKQEQVPEVKFEIMDEKVHSATEIKMDRSSSILSSDSKSKRSKSLLKKLSLFQAKKENYDYPGRVYNTISKIYVAGNNFVWVAKGPYLFSLKYDPFNGGEMYNRETIKFC